jgi:hypothetical protein
MEPLPDLVNGGTALRKKGLYYLFYFTEADRGTAEIDVQGESVLKVDMGIRQLADKNLS